MGIDYGLALRIINLEPAPKAALAALVARERERAAHEAKAEAWDEGHHRHAPVPAFGDTPCDCRNPYRD